MKPFLQAENLSKRWGELMLFEDISFTVFEEKKVALIAKNGTGKSTLLDILAGKETAEAGKVTLTNDIEIGYFEQIPKLNPTYSVIEEIFESDNEKLKTVKAFELAVAHNNQEEIAEISAKMDELNAWWTTKTTGTCKNSNQQTRPTYSGRADQPPRFRDD